jgi:hypothetical protein
MEVSLSDSDLESLEAEYRAAMLDSAAEQEALDWLEANIDEALDACNLTLLDPAKAPPINRLGKPL